MTRQETKLTGWRSIKGIDLRRLIEARLQAHYAVQWLARTARAYISPQPDDGHTSLLWDRTRDALTTQPLKAHLYFSLTIPSLVLTLHDVSLSEETLLLEGHSDLEIREWLGKTLSARGFDANALGSPSPYELPAHPVAMGAKYDASYLLPDALADLSAWFANADLLLSNLQRQMCERSFTASPVRCWPHHFDIATLIKLTIRKNGTVGYVNAGLSPGDEYYKGPYFYVSMFPEPDPALLPRLIEFDHWHTRDFTAAVLTWDKVLESKAPETACLDFMHTAVQASLKLLTS